jgi:hypothetical protein
VLGDNAGVDLNDPVQGAGLGFTGTSVIKGAINFLLPTTLTISAWVRPNESIDQMTIFSKGVNRFISFSFFLADMPTSTSKNVGLWMMTSASGFGQYVFSSGTVRANRWGYIQASLQYLGNG